MTAEDAEPATESPLPPISIWKVGVAIMMLGIIAFLSFILLRIFSSSDWEYSIEAATDVAEVSVPPDGETRWRIDGAIICTRDLPQRLSGFPFTRGGPCGSRSWRSWEFDEPEVSLRLNPCITAHFSKRIESGYAMSLRDSGKRPSNGACQEDSSADAGDSNGTTEKKYSIGALSVVGVIEDVSLGKSVNVMWTNVPRAGLTFPFTGSTTLGRTVSWSDSILLRSGSVVVYTADESADKRSMVDSASLMLGDQVRLGTESNSPDAKGFIRMDEGADSMQVVAFGRANSLRIERFGEGGYSFEPSTIRKLAADRAVAFWGSILAAYMTLILSLQPFVGGGDGDADAGPATDLLQRFNRWLRRKPNA